MNRRTLIAASLAAIAVMAALAWFVASGLPRNMPLPIHWNIEGKADGFADKWTALLMPAAIAAVVSLLFAVLPAIEPRKAGLERSKGLYVSAWAGVLLLCVLIQLAVIAAALHWAVHATSFVLAGVGILFVVIGNQLGKSRSMYMMGVRTPWTLASEEVWIKTHRLAGKLMVALGVLFVIAALLPLPSGMIMTVMLGGIGAVVLVPFVYSYVLWRREQAGPARG